MSAQAEARADVIALRRREAREIDAVAQDRDPIALDAELDQPLAQRVGDGDETSQPRVPRFESGASAEDVPE